MDVIKKGNNSTLQILYLRKLSTLYTISLLYSVSFNFNSIIIFKLYLQDEKSYHRHTFKDIYLIKS